MDTNEFNTSLRTLLDQWCERREYGALAHILPAWTGNNGLTDGWQDLHDSLKHAYVMRLNLPHEERDELKRLYVEIENALSK